MNKKDIEIKMPNHNIIAFGGRKESGKTELANICVEHGYEKLSFAKPLKLLTCELLGFDSIEALNEAKNKPMGRSIEDHDCYLINEACGASYEWIYGHGGALNKHSTVRDWLQVVGTDIIRSWNNDWHAEQTIKLIEPDRKYVIDDVRFPNELRMLQELNAECWFIIRTKVDNISHHASEESVDYTMFDNNVIVNDTSLQAMKIRWNIYMNTYVEVYPYRKRLIANLPHKDDTSMYFVYPEMKNLNATAISVKYIMESHHVKPNFENNKFIVGLGGIDMWEESNPFRIESMKKYYN